MGRPSKVRKDRTSLVIATVLHALLIGGIAYWAYKTGQIEKIRQAYLTYVRGEKKEKKEEPKPIQQKPVAPKQLPPINQGLSPAASSGNRRAVASDAPAAAGGETFFLDTRKQVTGPSTASTGATINVQTKVVAPPPVSRPTLQASRPSTIKAALLERAQATANIESFSSEQISKTGVSDAGDIVGKVAGATVVDGKFAIIRGLPERYASATLNGGEIPSADPYRKSVQLDLFPAGMIDKVIVVKTFTPDQPGGFTGGAIDIIAKSFPERFQFSLSAGVGYNSQATFNDGFLTYSGGGTDWLGWDDGKRGSRPRPQPLRT